MSAHPPLSKAQLRQRERYWARMRRPITWDEHDIIVSRLMAEIGALQEENDDLKAALSITEDLYAEAVALWL